MLETSKWPSEPNFCEIYTYSLGEKKLGMVLKGSFLKCGTIFNASDVRLERDSIVQQTSLKEYIKQDGLRDHPYIYVSDPSSLSG